jgi:hypothetical protein
MHKHAEFGQRFATRLTAAGRHGSLHINPGNRTEVTETGKALKRAGKFLIS